MRSLSASVVAVAVLTLALALPAGASRAQFALTGGIPMRAAGDVALDASMGLLLIDGVAPVPLETNAVRVHDASAPAPTTALVPPAPTASTFRLVPTVDGLRAILVGNAPHVDSRMAPPATTAVWDAANAQVSLLLRPLELTHGPDLVVPAGTHEARARDASFSIAPTRILLLAGALETTTSGVVTSLPVPPGGVLALDVAGARLAGTSGSATLYAPDLLLHLDGFARFAWAEGRIEGTATHGWIDDAVLLGGRFELRSLGADITGAPAVSWLGAGDVDFLHLGGSEASSTVPPMFVAGAAGVTLLGLAVAVYHWSSLRLAGAFLLAPLYARLRRDEVLDHAGRNLVYEKIRQDPGVSADRLASTVDFGWSTLAYHLRVLERTDLVVSVREGRHRRFFDREDGRFANGRKLAVAVLKNDHTLALGRAIRDVPGVTQKALSERFALSPSSVHWHVERLETVGLLEKRRDGHNVRYYPGPAWAGIEVPVPEPLVAPLPRSVGAIT